MEMSVSPPRILAIDDDQDILYTLSAIGKIAGWNVTTTRSGAEGIRLAASGVFDVVLLDYHMPDLDGLSVVRGIREAGGKMPIIVLTVDERLSLADEFLRAGADDFAVKPVKTADLISRVKSHINRAVSLENEALRYPKGLSPETARTIARCLLAHDRFMSADEVSALTGVAYPTACRYLDFLEQSGKVRVKLDYGVRGRPRRRYRWILSSS